MRISKNIIFATVINNPVGIEFKNILPLLVSLETSGFDGNLVIFNNFISEDEVSFIKNYKVILERVDPITSYLSKGKLSRPGEPDHLDVENGCNHISQSQIKRYFYQKLFLDKHDIDEDVFIESADGRDTWYQSDPFKNLDDSFRGVVTLGAVGNNESQEKYPTLGAARFHERDFSRNFHTKMYGQKHFEELKDSPVFCVASLISDVGTFKIFADLMVDELENLLEKGILSITADETAVQKVLLKDRRDLLNILPSVNSRIAHMALLGTWDFMIFEDKLYRFFGGKATGTCPSIVHHTDRREELVDLINNKTQEFVNDNNLPYQGPFVHTK